MGYVPPTWDEWRDPKKLDAWAIRGTIAFKLTAAAYAVFFAFILAVLIK